MASSARRRKNFLVLLLALILVLTFAQLALYLGIVKFYLSYVVPPFLSLIATFICALINILFYQFFQKHHLNLLYVATALPFVFFLLAVILHFFEDTSFLIAAVALAGVSVVWYILLVRETIKASTGEV